MKKQQTRKSLTVVFLVAIAVILAACILLVLTLRKRQINEFESAAAANLESVIDSGFYPLNDVMEADGYTEDKDNTFSKTVSNKEIAITFDIPGGVCKKNQYEFSLQGKILQYDSKYYIQRDTLENILNCTLTYENGEIQATPLSYEQHEWTQVSSLIAHAGGAVREASFNSPYTNSVEALIQNYNLGHRVFEFDFYLTSDNKLASVHDWVQFGNMNGVAMSSEEWRNFKTFSPITDGRYTTMFIDDILDEMLVNKDMFIVTDTKSTEVSYEEALLQFQLIYEAAVERDPELLNRIVPQIYNNEMYDMIMSVYDFPSVIYTAYATSLTGEEITEFSAGHDNIKVITAPVNDNRFSETVIQSIHDNDMLIYNHTLNNYSDITDGRSKGIDGFYTDLLLPSDIMIYENETEA